MIQRASRSSLLAEYRHEAAPPHVVSFQDICKVVFALEMRCMNRDMANQSTSE